MSKTALDTNLLGLTGPLAIGLSPSNNWWVNMMPIELGRAGNGVFGATNDNEINVGANVINTGSGAYKYGTGDSASLYRQVSGQHVWYYAPFGTAGATISLKEAMRTDVNGSVGIGTIPKGVYTDFSFLEVGGTTWMASNFNGNSYQGKNWYYTGGVYKYKAVSPATLYVQDSSGHGWNVAPSGAADAAITWTLAARIDFSGNLLIGKGAATSGGGDLQISKGISFPSAAVSLSDPNTLDAYEEGTFTPIIGGATTAGAGTYSTQVGRYTRIGNRVFITGTLAWSAHSGTGNMYIGGMPYVPNNAAQNRPVLSVIADGLTYTGTSLGCYFAAGFALAYLYNQSSNTALVGVTMDSSGYIAFSGHYDI
jgi:hypothetical protein